MRFLKSKILYFSVIIIMIDLVFINYPDSNTIFALPADPCAPYSCSYNRACPGQSNESKPTCGLYVIWSRSAA